MTATNENATPLVFAGMHIDRMRDLMNAMGWGFDQLRESLEMIAPSAPGARHTLMILETLDGLRSCQFDRLRDIEAKVDAAATAAAAPPVTAPMAEAA